MDSYGFLAAYYDGLTADVDYCRWADYLEKHFARAPRPVRAVADLGCGTGSLALELAERGYEVTGVDLSTDMLAVAADKLSGLKPSPLLVCQDMSRLNLGRQVDAVVCCLDSLNYVTRPKAAARVFHRVYEHLRPGGLFLFDIRTPDFLRAMDGQMFVDDTGDAYCVWRGAFSPKTRVLTYCMDLFAHTGGDCWARAGEVHREYAYEPAELSLWLEEAGFTAVKQYGNLKLRPPGAGEERICFTAYKGER